MMRVDQNIQLDREKKTLIKNGRLIIGRKVYEGKAVVVHQGKIIEILDYTDTENRDFVESDAGQAAGSRNYDVRESSVVLDLEGRYLSAGLIETQINGALGIDFSQFSSFLSYLERYSLEEAIYKQSYVPEMYCDIFEGKVSFKQGKIHFADPRHMRPERTEAELRHPGCRWELSNELRSYLMSFFGPPTADCNCFVKAKRDLLSGSESYTSLVSSLSESVSEHSKEMLERLTEPITSIEQDRQLEEDRLCGEALKRDLIDPILSDEQHQQQQASNDDCSEPTIFRASELMSTNAILETNPMKQKSLMQEDLLRMHFFRGHAADSEKFEALKRKLRDISEKLGLYIYCKNVCSDLSGKKDKQKQCDNIEISPAAKDLAAASAQITELYRTKLYISAICDGRVHTTEVVATNELHLDLEKECARLVSMKKTLLSTMTYGDGKDDLCLIHGKAAIRAFMGDFIRSQMAFIGRYLLTTGVTTFCPTIVSLNDYTSLPYIRAYTGSAHRGASVHGLHLEGPFISKIKRGCHQETYLHSEIKGLATMEACYLDLSQVAIITMAPELPGFFDTMRELESKYRGKVQVSIGHSNAEMDVVTRAVISGCRMVTHLPNAMTSFDHRRPGFLGVLVDHIDLDLEREQTKLGEQAIAEILREAKAPNACPWSPKSFIDLQAEICKLTDDAITKRASSPPTSSSSSSSSSGGGSSELNEVNAPYFGVIADGIHLHPRVVSMLNKLAPEKLMLVTDAMAGAGLPDGMHLLGNQEVVKKSLYCCLPGTSTLAGSCVDMQTTIRNFKAFTGSSIGHTIACASLHPARALKISDTKGDLVEGADADLIVFDETLVIQCTIIQGEVGYVRL